MSASCPAAQGFVPQGDEFRANTFTAGTQRYPSMGLGAAGDLVLAWTSAEQDGSGFGVFAQRYDAVGAAQGPEFRVNTATTSFQAYPSVAVDPDGDVTVVWQSFGQDGGHFGVYGQRYAATGEPRGGEFRVNTTTQGSQGGPAVAVDADGDLVVVWSSEAQDGSGYGVYGQRYDAAGAARGGEFQVNTTTEGVQAFPSVAVDADGDAVVVWSSEFQDGSGLGIYGQRYDAAGGAQGAEFRVNEATAGNQSLPSVALDADGDFAVTWSSDEQDGSGGGIYARRYDAGGAVQGAEFQVNTTTVGNQANPTAALDAAGGLVVVWSSDGQDGNSYGVYARRYDASGVARSGELPVNTATANFQGFPVVGADARGGVAVVWESLDQDGSEFGVYAQRYGAAPVAAEPSVPAAAALALVPNPVGAGGGRVRYALAAPGLVRVTVSDVLGRIVAVLADGERPAGPHEARFETGGLAPGVYVVRLEADASQTVCRVTVVR